MVSHDEYIKNKAYYVKYHADRRDIENAKKREHVVCDCGARITYSGMCLHRKTKKHMRGMERIQAGPAAEAAAL